jgi:hypothetical protein
MNFEAPNKIKSIPKPELAKPELAERASQEEQQVFQGVLEKLGRNKKLKNLTIALSFFSFLAISQIGCGKKPEKPSKNIEQQQNDYERWSSMKKSNFEYAVKVIQNLGNKMEKEIKDKGRTSRIIARDIVGIRINQLALAQKQGVDIRSGARGNIGIADRFMVSKDLKTYLAVLADKNKDGDLSQEEKDKFEKNPAIKILREKMQTIDTFDSLDKNKDGNISQEEEANYIKKLSKGGLKTLSEEGAKKMKKDWNKPDSSDKKFNKKPFKVESEKKFDKDKKSLPVQGQGASSNPNNF